MIRNNSYDRTMETGVQVAIHRRQRRPPLLSRRGYASTEQEGQLDHSITWSTHPPRRRHPADDGKLTMLKQSCLIRYHTLSFDTYTDHLNSARSLTRTTHTFVLSDFREGKLILVRRFGTRYNCDYSNYDRVSFCMRFIWNYYGI